MKSFTRIGLPILIVMAAVFGITFIRVYSPEDPSTAQAPGAGPGKAKAKKEPPLQFPILEVAPAGQTPEPKRESLFLWSGEYEVGTPGHFDFWALNLKREPVSIHVFDVNCQCAGIDLAVVPPDAFREYAFLSALANGPLGSGPVGSAVAHATLARRLDWKALLDRDNPTEKPDRTVPGAESSETPQRAIVRLQWKGKTEPGSKEIGTRLLASIANEESTRYELRVNSMAVPAFELIRQTGPDVWEGAGDVSIGELREGGEVRRVVYCFSATRKSPVYTVTAEQQDPCVTWTDPVPASATEIQALTDYFSQPGRPARRAKSLYRFEVRVRERVEAQENGKTVLHQLDLGLLDRRLTVSSVDGGSITVPTRGRVLGEVNFLTGSSDGRIDLGNAIPANQDWVKDAILIADRPGLVLAVAQKESRPNYLQIRLDPLEKIDGRSQWRLRVTVPKGSLLGALPPDSAVVLTTTGPQARRFRIPVRGISYDSGDPRF